MNSIRGKKRTVDDFLAEDIDITLRKTEKKLSDIFHVNRSYDTQAIDEETRVDWLPLMKSVEEVYRKRHRQKLSASHLIPS